jgi:hypothetical protein
VNFVLGLDGVDCLHIFSLKSVIFLTKMEIHFSQLDIIFDTFDGILGDLFILSHNKIKMLLGSIILEFLDLFFLVRDRLSIFLGNLSKKVVGCC